jgi:anthranilate synthase component 1
MQIIDELETVKRGAYGGAVGLSLLHGGARHLHLHPNGRRARRVRHVQAGGGTVADAQPAYEFEESKAKARGVVRAIELATRQAEWP